MALFFSLTFFSVSSHTIKQKKYYYKKTWVFGIQTWSSLAKKNGPLWFSLKISDENFTDFFLEAKMH